MRTKRGDVEVGWIFLTVLVLVFLVWLTQYSARACHSNVDCGDNAYCGSDFACHQYPVQKIVERQVVQASPGVVNDLVVPSLVIGLAIIISALVVRWRNTPHQPERHDPSRKADSQQFEHYGEDVHEEKKQHH